MTEVIPRVAVGAIVLTNCSPLALAKIGSPFLPRDLRPSLLLKSDVFSGRIQRSGLNRTPQLIIATDAEHNWQNEQEGLCGQAEIDHWTSKPVAERSYQCWSQYGAVFLPVISFLCSGFLRTVRS